MYTASFLVLRSAREYIDSDLPAALIVLQFWAPSFWLSNAPWLGHPGAMFSYAPSPGDAIHAVG